MSSLCLCPLNESHGLKINSFSRLLSYFRHLTIIQVEKNKDHKEEKQNIELFLSPKYKEK